MTEVKWRKLFSKKLKDRIEVCGLTQKELAVEANISEAAVSKYCSGERLPQITQLIKMTEVLGCTIDELVKF